jgi:hypothetical protein
MEPSRSRNLLVAGGAAVRTRFTGSKRVTECTLNIADTLPAVQIAMRRKRKPAHLTLSGFFEQGIESLFDTGLVPDCAKGRRSVRSERSFC